MPAEKLWGPHSVSEGSRTPCVTQKPALAWYSDAVCEPLSFLIWTVEAEGPVACGTAPELAKQESREEVLGCLERGL